MPSTSTIEKTTPSQPPAETNRSRTPAERAAEAGEFEIVYRGVLLAERSSNLPGTYATFGNVAFVPGRGLVARCESPTIPGSFKFGYKPWLENSNAPPPEASWSRDPQDLRARIDAEVERLQCSVNLHPLEPTPLELEIEQFRRNYPLLTEHLGLIKFRPTPLFEPGPRRYPIKYDPRFIGIDWAAYSDRHVGGDFGNNGRFDPAPLQDPATEWLVGLAPIGVQNTYCIRSREGIVRSVYEVPDDIKSRLKITSPGPDDLVVAVDTILDARQPRTLLRLVNRGQVW